MDLELLLPDTATIEPHSSLSALVYVYDRRVWVYWGEEWNSPTVATDSLAWLSDTTQALERVETMQQQFPDRQIVVSEELDPFADMCIWVPNTESFLVEKQNMVG